MPTRFRLSPSRATRVAASAATLALTLSAAAAQPRLPDPPPAPHDEHPLPGDTVPHDVVPAHPVPAHPVPAHPVPADLTPAYPAPLHDGLPPSHVSPPDHTAPYSAEPVPPFGGAPLFDPHHHDSFVPPHGPPPHGPPGHGPPPSWTAPGPPPAGWTPPGPPGPPPPSYGSAVPMRPMAPLAMLPPVEADPTLGPPPGTLGHTYYRPSRYVPYDEHPRVGMLDLTLPPELTVDQGPCRKIRVTIHDVAGQLKPLKGYVGDDKHWHFESDPLTPGIPHVYRVKVERVYYENQEIRRYGRLVTQEVETGSDLLGVRYLRLIPGRIVTLEF